MKKRVSVLGVTGSIGKNTLDVLRLGKDDFTPVLFSARKNRRGLAEAAEEWPGAAQALAEGEEGRKALLAAIAAADADITVNGISGAAGLEFSMAAIDSGSDLALANKETVVMAGPLVFKRALEKGVRIIPVDSEHSAIFHLVQSRGADDVEEIILTASGGPFRNFSLEEMGRVSPAEALVHPTWSMGPKISVDSASLANKGLEIIEAAGLFNMPPDKIRVLVHPQSIVHSMIRLRDGAVYAQLSRPDMRLPIHEALYWPETRASPFGKLDFESLTLEFKKPDFERFPMLGLAYEAVKKGGLYPCVYNAANEAAVALFLSGDSGFLDIPRIVGYVLNRGWNGEVSDLASILKADGEARIMAENYIKGKQACFF
ncbi:MAG: 1-deoxy-D-xylulose-5-phosphate reductoisomerase [Treponema sp.]|jgi:1-deoxy-D-xylulose-5-phosphate reductoisomerase|nr:1-deoxy-D-xylulose-5-phosphate reductoisomerase [Treponema sp.]